MRILNCPFLLLDEIINQPPYKCGKNAFRMKKLYFLGIVALLLAAACNREPVEVIFRVDPVSAIEFTEDGGFKTFEVTYNGTGAWSATTEDEWIEILGGSGSGSGTVFVRVAEHIFGSRQGIVTVHADGFSPVVIEVSQEGFTPEPEPDHISQRSSWSRLNLKGYVDKLSLYFNDTEQPRVTMHNLEFNKYGMLTKFQVKANMALNTGTINVEYSSSDPQQIVKISGTTPYNTGTFIMELEYGTHGKYIPVEDIFFQVDNQGLYTFWRLWMPRLIHNLERVVFVQDYKDDIEDMEMWYEITGDTGELWISSVYQGEYSEQAFQWLTFSGDYPTEVNYMWAGLGFAMNYYSIYDIDTTNGYFNSYELSIERAMSWIERSYNSDSYNSISSMMDFDITGDTTFPMVYDAQGNITDFGDGTITYRYVYDDRNNWTTVTRTGDEAETVTRTVEYK